MFIYLMYINGLFTGNSRKSTIKINVNKVTKGKNFF